MKASERLRELDGAMERGTSAIAFSRELVALRYALPLIADVVEAAERIETIAGAGGAGEIPAMPIAREARAALTALRDALEGGDK